MNFYLYSYAVSISVASSIASKIINGDTGETAQKQIQYTRSRDITISFDFPETTSAILMVLLKP